MVPKTVDAEQFQKEVLESDIPVLVDFWAEWCMPCRMMAPVLDDMAKEFNGKIKIAKVNTESMANAQLASLYDVMSIPNMKMFKGGEMVGEYIGYRPSDVFKKELQTFLDN